MQTPKFNKLLVQKGRGGKRPFWTARHMDYYTGKTPATPLIVGAGGSADLAIRDYQRQWRLVMNKKS